MGSELNSAPIDTGPSFLNQPLTSHFTPMFDRQINRRN